MHTVHSVGECERIIEQGWRNRAVGYTLMNKDSSRSHSIFTIHLEICSTGEHTHVHTLTHNDTITVTCWNTSIIFLTKAFLSAHVILLYLMKSQATLQNNSTLWYHQAVYAYCVSRVIFCHSVLFLWAHFPLNLYIEYLVQKDQKYKCCIQIIQVANNKNKKCSLPHGCIASCFVSYFR